MLYTSLRSQDRSLNKTHHHTQVFSLKMCGTTLIELITTISIVSILTAIAGPNLNDFIVEMRVDNEISRLSRLLLTARNHSINSGQNTILCPLAPNGTCTQNWHQELSVFIDVNGNQQFDSAGNETLITTKSSIKISDTLKYAKSRTKITYQPTGHLFGLANGTFRYCPEGHLDKSRGIIIARSGRFYASTDINHDGIDETRSNNIISCD